MSARDEFREAVFARSYHLCVICGADAVDAHHIIERRLFPDGGYDINNGAALCETHHLAAESTELTCEEIREAAGIDVVVLPPDLYADTRYDKWGNPYREDGIRFKGPFYFDPSVRKIIKGDFVDYVKYPRTFHLPWSEGRTKDDRVMPNVNSLLNRSLIITEKMDGENTTFYRDFIHARSFDYGSHPSRDRIKSLHATVCGEIPYGWRICGENVYARHSIPYTDLKSFFLVFSIWNEANECLSWRETEEWCKLLGLETVPVFAHLAAAHTEEQLRDVCGDLYWKAESFNSSMVEGYVVRPAEEFELKDFSKVVGKYVRKNHVQTSSHWKYERVVPNELRQET